MIDQVLMAIKDAFHPHDVENHLVERGGRVFGSVRVIGSANFDALDDIRRQRLLWQQLRGRLKAEAVRVGPVTLEPTNRG
ncbi:MAG TPA: hypothetical protein VKT77_01945 [Chthonomonadaceae bacterium]|nr:hypothetical protein [Chthonomonadaceae bacterium]